MNCRPRPSDPFSPRAPRQAEAAVGEEIRYAFGSSSLGSVLVAAGARGLVSVSVSLAQASPASLLETLRAEFPPACLVREHGTLDDLLPRVLAFIEHPAGVCDLPLDLRGSEFQKSVWRAVQAIPCGQTRSYSDIATAIGSPKAIRAVASACARCKFSLLIPCHRVLHKDGTPTGGGGEENWQTVLLRREGVC